MRPEPTDKDKATDAQVKPAELQADQDRAPLHRAPAITYQVARNGDVTYQRDGRDMLRDAGRSVHMLQQDAQTIETGLRLAQQKFGSKLALSGPQDFQEKAARIAAEAGLKVEFSDQRPEQDHARAPRPARRGEGTRSRGPQTGPGLRQTARAGEGQGQGAGSACRPSEGPGTARAGHREQGTQHRTQAATPARLKPSTASMWYQRHGRDVIRHDRKHFNEAPQPGDQVQVTYRQGKATVKNLGQEREIDGPSFSR